LETAQAFSRFHTDHPSYDPRFWQRDLGVPSLVWLDQQSNFTQLRDHPANQYFFWRHKSR
jgi:hypothetical protein